MAISKITSAEIEERLIENLPTRPNSPTTLGGKGYTANELKAAFDALPRLVAERFNDLIDDITSEDSSEIKSLIKTGIKESHTLNDLFSDIQNSTILDYLIIDDEPLSVFLRGLKSDLESMKRIVMGG